MGETERPGGVTVLAVLQFIGGVVVLLLGFATMSMAPMSYAERALANILGTALVVSGLVSFAIAYGLWRGSGWAWWLSLVFGMLGIFGGMLSLPSGVFSMFIDLIIVFYLTRDNVKEFFGR